MPNEIPENVNTAVQITPTEDMLKNGIDKKNLTAFVLERQNQPLKVTNNQSLQGYRNTLIKDADEKAAIDAYSEGFGDYAKTLNNAQVAAHQKALYDFNYEKNLEQNKLLEAKMEDDKKFRNSFWGSSVGQMLQILVPPLMVNTVNHELNQRSYDKDIASIEMQKNAINNAYRNRMLSISGANEFNEERLSKLASDYKGQREAFQQTSNTGYQMPDTGKQLVDIYKASATGTSRSSGNLTAASDWLGAKKQAEANMTMLDKMLQLDGSIDNRPDMETISVTYNGGNTAVEEGFPQIAKSRYDTARQVSAVGISENEKNIIAKNTMNMWLRNDSFSTDAAVKDLNDSATISNLRGSSAKYYFFGNPADTVIDLVQDEQVAYLNNILNNDSKLNSIYNQLKESNPNMTLTDRFITKMPKELVNAHMQKMSGISKNIVNLYAETTKFGKGIQGIRGSRIVVDKAKDISNIEEEIQKAHIYEIAKNSNSPELNQLFSDVVQLSKDDVQNTNQRLRGRETNYYANGNPIVIHTDSDGNELVYAANFPQLLKLNAEKAYGIAKSELAYGKKPAFAPETYKLLIEALSVAPAEVQNAYKYAAMHSTISGKDVMGYIALGGDNYADSMIDTINVLPLGVLNGDAEDRQAAIEQINIGKRESSLNYNNYGDAKWN